MNKSRMVIRIAIRHDGGGPYVVIKEEYGTVTDGIVVLPVRDALAAEELANALGVGFKAALVGRTVIIDEAPSEKEVER